MVRRGESIFKRKDGRWEARYIKQINDDGAKKYGSIYAKTYKEAKEKKASLFMTLEDNTPTLSVEVVINEWLHAISNQIKKSSYQKYYGLAHNHIIPRIGHVEIKHLNHHLLTNFTSILLKQGRVNGGPLTKKTVNDILIILKMALNYANETHHIYVPKIPLLKEEKKEASVLKPDDLQKLMTYLLTDINQTKFGILLALYTGMRIGEICALKWTDVKEDYIYVSKTLYRLSENGKTAIYYSDPKSVSSIRIIPIHDDIKPIIEIFRKEDGFVLQQSNLKPIEPRLLQIQFKKMVQHLNIQNVTFHTLRHTFATRCIEVGFDVKTLSEILGHADVKTTLNRYVHSSFELKKHNMKKLTY